MLAVMLAAKLLRRLGHHERATEYFNSLLSIQEKVLGTDHAEVIEPRTFRKCALSSFAFPLLVCFSLEVSASFPQTRFT